VRQRTSPAPRMGQGLDKDLRKSNSSKFQTKVKLQTNRQLILERIADRWASRGYYRTPTRAMFALLQGVL